MVNIFFPPWRGGAETYVYNLAKRLVERGHEMEVFCANPPKPSGVETVEGVKAHKLKASAYSINFSALTSKSLSKKTMFTPLAFFNAVFNCEALPNVIGVAENFYMLSSPSTTFRASFFVPSLEPSLTTMIS